MSRNQHNDLTSKPLEVIGAGSKPQTPAIKSRAEKLKQKEAHQGMEIDTPQKTQQQPTLTEQKMMIGDEEKPPRKKIGALFIALKGSAHVYLESGLEYTVPLPFAVRQVWALGGNGGLLLQRKVEESELRVSAEVETIPTMYSLSHPLDELKPVSVQLSSGSGISGCWQWSRSKLCQKPDP
jgi:hypothetical protein